ncbi:hypothetical protein BH11ARM2_BH11ARM2_33230 [soil metagenome]
MKKRKIALGILGVLLLGLIIWVGPVVRDLVGAGFLERVDKKDYIADREGNLKAIYTALNLYHDSEGAYPPARIWMDAIEPRLKSNNLSEESAGRKLVRPGVPKGGFGYAISPLAAGRYKDDVKGERILVSESEDTSRNASGKPKSGSLAVTSEGKIVTVR